MSEYKYVTSETLDDGTIARIMLNRPESRNAQSRRLLVDLNDVCLGGTGPLFSSGHDNRMPAAMPEDGIQAWKDAPPIVLSTKDEVRSSA